MFKLKGALTSIQVRGFIGDAGLLLIGLFSLLYSIFIPDFAKLHISFSFLDFPVFIGEILLIVCVILFLAYCRFFPVRLNRWHYLLLVYVGFILVKAFYGYFKWGPLAFRNAALFYYPLFAVFGYYFFKSRLFREKISLFTILLILSAIILLRVPKSYFRYPYYIFALVLFLSVDRKLIRYTGIVFFFILLFCKPYTIFINALSVLIAQAVAALFLMLILLYRLKIKVRYKTLLFSFFIIVLGLLTCIYGRRGNIRILRNPLKLLSHYHRSIQWAEAMVGDFKPEDDIPVYLYERADYTRPTGRGTKSEEVATEQYKPAAYDSNAVWRMILWRDMFKEFIESKRFIFGLDFGKPFRSKSIWILEWDEDWKKRVGWFEPHNSYIHILYRAGAIGLLFIATVWGLLIRMSRLFIKSRSIKGILLSSVLIYWLVITNFVVILELPYFAIPFWSLFGMTLRYSGLSVDRRQPR